MTKAATTRFLLGRRGRHLYPLRGPSTAPTSTSTASILEPSKPAGRHGVPPPKQGWNCKKQQAYAYGFPIPPQSHKSWMTSPVVLITLTLLSACFVGAYCLVLRIDQQVQHGTVHPTSTSPSASSMSSLRAAASTTRLQQQKEHTPSLVPLYLNVTIFQIPCEELTVQVVQANHSEIHSEKRDKLVFKNVVVDTNPTPSVMGGRSLAKEEEDDEHKLDFKDVNPPEEEEQKEEDATNRRLEEEGEEEDPAEEEDYDGVRTDAIRPTTTGCQVMGHLQLPLEIGNHQRKQSAVVSFKFYHNHHHDLSHRVDYLKIGSTHSFPKEESMFLKKFQPHMFTHETIGGPIPVTHRYQVYDNFHLVEQPDPEEAHGGEGSEIQLIFAPAQQRPTRR